MGKLPVKPVGVSPLHIVCEALMVLPDTAGQLQLIDCDPELTLHKVVVSLMSKVWSPVESSVKILLD